MISRSGHYCLRALIVLAEAPEGVFVGARKLAETVGAPPNYLGKLLAEYQASGLLVSRKGKRGGGLLARAAEEITLYEALDPIEGFSRWSGCLLDRGECSSESPCPVHERWAVVREGLLKILHETTLAELRGWGGPRLPPFPAAGGRPSAPPAASEGTDERKAE